MTTPIVRPVVTEDEFLAAGWRRFHPFFITNARPTHHRQPTRKCATMFPDVSQPRCANPNQGHLGCHSVTPDCSGRIPDASLPLRRCRGPSTSLREVPAPLRVTT